MVYGFQETNAFVSCGFPAFATTNYEFLCRMPDLLAVLPSRGLVKTSGVPFFLLNHGISLPGDYRFFFSVAMGRCWAALARSWALLGPKTFLDTDPDGRFDRRLHS